MDVDKIKVIMSVSDLHGLYVFFLRISSFFRLPRLMENSTQSDRVKSGWSQRYRGSYMSAHVLVSLMSMQQLRSYGDKVKAYRVLSNRLKEPGTELGTLGTR